MAGVANPCGPHHFASSAGLVRALKIRSRGARRTHCSSSTKPPPCALMTRPSHRARPGTLPETAGSADHAYAATVRVALHRALRELSPRQRAVIVLRYFEDRTEVETAEPRGLAVGTVKTLAQRALHRLRAAAELSDPMTMDGADR